METVHSSWNGQPFTLCPIGDVQLGAGGAHVSRFRRHIEWCLAQESPMFIGLGDYGDVASPSNRQRLKSAALYDSVMEALEEAAERERQVFMEAIQGTEGRWLGLLEGHHFYEYADGSTTDLRITEDLNTRHLGSSCLVEVSNKEGPEGRHLRHPRHGLGVCRAAAPITKLERISRGIDADIYIMGHMSKKATVPVDRLYVRPDGSLTHRTIMFAGSGGFSQGYTQGSKQGRIPRGSYVEQGMMTPVALGAPVIQVQWDYDEWRPDIHASV